MTEDDKRNCRSDTLEDLAEMRAQRRCLVTKTESMQRQLERGLAVTRTILATKPGDLAVLKGTPPDEGNWPSYADLVSTHEDVRKTCSRIHVLNGRLREWGVID